jgi:hypothetical protein
VIHFNNKVRISLFLILLAAGVFILAWVYWPHPQTTRVFTLPAIQSGFLPANEGEVGSIPAGLIEAHLSWPEDVQLGEPFHVELVINPVENQPLANSLVSSRLVTEARLDLPMLVVSPSGGVQQAFDPNHQIYFQWQIDPVRMGRFDGNFWLYILIVNEAGEIDRQAMLSAPITVHSKSLFGLSVNLWVWFGWLFLFSALASLVLIKQK